jgi:hypothetical protein
VLESTIAMEVLIDFVKPSTLRHTLKILIAQTCLSLIYIFLFTGTASATFTDMPQNLAADGQNASSSNTTIHLSTLTNDSSGNGGFVDDVTIRMYTQKSGSLSAEDKTISLYQVGAAGTCNDSMNMNYAGSSLPGGSTKSNSSCGPINYFVPETAFQAGPAGTRMATVTFTLVTSGTVDIRQISSGGATRLGFVGGRAVPVSTNNTGGEYSLQVKFGVPCSTASPVSNVFWRDDDYGLNPEKWSGDPNGTNLTARAVNNDTGNTIGSQPNWGGKGLGWMAVSLKGGGNYSLEFGKLNTSNVINVEYPYDSGEFYIDCQPPPNSEQDYKPTALFSASCESVQIYSLDDINQNGQGVKYAIAVWDKGAAAFSGTSIVSRGTGYTTFSNMPPPGQSNDGYTILVQVYNVRTDGTDAGNGDAMNILWSVDTGPCYQASCRISIPSNIGGSSDEIEAGRSFTAKVTIRNLSDNTPLPQYVGGNFLSATGTGGSLAPGAHQLDAGGSIAPNDEYTFDLTFTAPSGATNGKLGFYPDYWGRYPIGQPCYRDFKTYSPFNLTPTASAQPGTGASVEDLTSVDYNTYVTNSAGGSVDAFTTSSRFYKTGGSDIETDSGGTYASGKTSTLGPKTYTTPKPISAGEQWCARIQVPYTSAFRGPGGASDITGKTNDSSINPSLSCVRVENRAFFKVYGSSVAAGGDFSVSSSGQCTGDGVLAGWFNNTNYDGTNSGYSWGSSTDLSALALIKITGFASAQTSSHRSPTDLTFANSGGSGANTVNVTTGSYSPELGGKYDPGGSRCLSTQDPGTDATKLSGDQSIDGRTLGTNDTQSYFVTGGDVYIKDDIKYDDTANWTKGHVPSFVLNVKGGNIYIAPGVTQLDGLYTAEPDSGGDGGTIYTCGSAYAAMPLSQLYDNCYNQLTVHGAFVARHVNLMRTYGSLRDEKPSTTTTTGTQTVDLPDPDITWSDNGVINRQVCTQINEPSDPHTWSDNYLCVPKDSSLSLTWTYGGPAGPPPTDSDHPYCIQWNVSDPDAWDDNYLCSNQDIDFSFGANNDNKYCTEIDEPSDPDGNWRGGGYYLCTSKTGSQSVPKTVAGPPAKPYTCSNSRGTLKSPSTSNTTCAAEIFEFSPEFYLGKPGIKRPDTSTGVWDSVTSLPPVL